MLDNLAKILESKNLGVSYRGVDAARFLYVTSPERAIEASEDGDQLCIEFWESSDEDADDPSVKECICETVAKAVIEIETWLRQ